MKSDILRMLREAKDYISGQDICETFGVSRTAVWKYMKQLKEEGYKIEAVQNRGYRLMAVPDILSEEEIGSRLNTKWAGRTIVYKNETDTTNNLAKKLGEKEAPHGSIAVAEVQTAGKGRRGRSWTSPPRTGVWMTIMLRPEINPSKASMLTIVMAAAAAKACQEVSGIPIQIKWPNDLVASGKKLCGILTEMSAETDHIHYVTIGVGINVNMEEFPKELADKATSLKIEGKSGFSRVELIQKLLTYFEEYYDIFIKEQDLKFLQKEYNDRLVNVGGIVRVLEPGNEYEGISHGIDNEGRLLVEREYQRIEKVFSGEVSVRGLYSYT